MVSVLYIGYYNKDGKFNTIQWRSFIEWCKTECNKINVYSRMPYDIICSKFPLYCDVKELQMPDELMRIYAYEIHVIEAAFWNYIYTYNYNIDIEDDISHSIFFYEKRDVASLEIVDYENYVLIEEPINQKDKFLSNEKLILDNIQYCFEGKSDIEDLVQEGKWKPLGQAL